MSGLLLYGEVMCTIVVAWQCFDDAPVLVAANRDEAVSRRSVPPAQLQHSPVLWGGRDAVAGGTWLAVDPSGRVCAVTNRHPGGQVPSRDDARNSRGIIPQQVLTATSDEAACAVMDDYRSADFNPVNVLYLSPGTAYWTALDEAGRHTRHLTPGIHVLTEQDPDDSASAKTTALRERAQALVDCSPDPSALMAALRSLLGSHDRLGVGPQSAACIHADTVPDGRFGTVSSATVVVGADGVRYDHAEGYPCRTPYQRVLG